MSQSQRKRKNQTLSQSGNTGEAEEMQNLSIEELTKKCVRYLLTKMHSNTGIKKADIVHHVFHEKPGKNFDVVFKNATNTLTKVYGLNIDVIDSDTATKKYFVTNSLPYAHFIPNDVETDMKSVITFLVLTHIFMTQNSSTDNELWQFLKEFDIQPETDIEGVGIIKVFITQTLVKQNYIILEDRGGDENEAQKKYYRWGSRAEETVKKMDILKFVSNVLETPDVKFWSEQYKDASQQISEK